MGPSKGEKFMVGKQLATRIAATGKWQVAGDKESDRKSDRERKCERSVSKFAKCYFSYFVRQTMSKTLLIEFHRDVLKFGQKLILLTR